MSDLGFNKIAFCVLGTGLALIGLNEASHAMFHSTHHEKMAWAVAISEDTGGGPAVVEGPRDYGVLLAAADLAKGEEQHKKCLQCHNFDSGGANMQGPNLFGVVGRPVASHPGFKYSTGKGSLTELGGEWTFERLDHFIERPKLANEQIHVTREVLGDTSPEGIARRLGHEPSEEEIAAARAEARQKYMTWQKESDTWAGWRVAAVDEVIAGLRAGMK